MGTSRLQNVNIHPSINRQQWQQTFCNISTNTCPITLIPPHILHLHSQSGLTTKHRHFKYTVWRLCRIWIKSQWTKNVMNGKFYQCCWTRSIWFEEMPIELLHGIFSRDSMTMESDTHPLIYHVDASHILLSNANSDIKNNPSMHALRQRNNILEDPRVIRMKPYLGALEWPILRWVVASNAVKSIFGKIPRSYLCTHGPLMNFRLTRK